MDTQIRIYNYGYVIMDIQLWIRNYGDAIMDKQLWIHNYGYIKHFFLVDEIEIDRNIGNNQLSMWLTTKSTPETSDVPITV